MDGKLKSDPPEICRGCRTYEQILSAESIWCTMHRHDHVDICPCMECLVKGICSELCEDYKNIINEDCEE